MRPIRPRTLLLLLLALAGQPPAGAQQRSSIEVGVAHINQSHVAREQALTAGFLLNVTRSHFTLLGNAIAAFAPNDESAAQGAIAGSLFGDIGARGRWEIGALLGSALYEGREHTLARSIFVRQSLQGFDRGLWIGGRFGDLSFDTVRHSAAAAEVGAWLTRGEALISGTISSVWTQSPVINLSAFEATGSGLPLSFIEALLQARQSWRRFEAEAGAGYRASLVEEEPGRPFVTARGTWWFADELGVAAALGRELSDPARGLPETRFATLSLRYTPGRTTKPSAVILREGTRAAVIFSSAGEVALLIADAGATRVEISGDFTDWQPLELTRVERRWTGLPRLAPGSYSILVRIDGGEWFAPENLPKRADDFGGTVGLLVVP